MARSQQTFSKIEKEKAKKKKKEDKIKKREAKKAEKETNNKGIQFAYVDQYGNLSDTPPNPADKIKVDAEDIVLGVPKKEEGDERDPVRTGKVSFYDNSKGFGFIIDIENNEKYFCHVSGLIDDIAENDRVTFELEKGLKGMNAVKVKQKSASDSED